MFIVHNFYTHLLAGTELYTYNLAKKLIQKGHRVKIVYPVFDSACQHINIYEENFEDISLVKILLRPPRNMIEGLKNEYVANAFNYYLSKNLPDLVHFQHFYRISFSPLSVCFEHGIPVIASLHDEWILCERIHYLQPDGKLCSGPETVDKCVKCFIEWHPEISLNDKLIEFLKNTFSFRRQYLLNALSWIDILTVPSLFLKNELSKHGFIHPETILLPLGVHPFNIIPHQPSQDSLRLSFIGNIAFTKGLDVLIKAFNNIKANNIELNIYGKVLDENYFVQVDAVNLKSDKVKYHGAYTPQELPEILSKTDIVIIPSRSESYSLVVRECLYCGVPVIASNVGGIPEIIKDGENGLLFDPGNYKELANKIQLVINNPEIIKTLRSNIKPVQTIDEDVERLEEIYKETLLRKTHIML